MGFFSDLKEDLSQAVNDLEPAGELETVPTQEQIPEILIEQAETTEDVMQEEITEEHPNGSTPQNDFFSEPIEPIKDNKGVEISMEFNKNEISVDETSIITAGMNISGDIISKGSMDVIGEVIGNIDILGNLHITGCVKGDSKATEIYAEGAKINGDIISDGSVKIGINTVIVGNITATSASISGAVNGEIDVQGPVILDSSAVVMGNIKSKSIQINNGAVIEGMCSQCYADVNPASFFEDYEI